MRLNKPEQNRCFFLYFILHIQFLIFQKSCGKLFACVDTIFKIHLFYFVKDYYFKCFLPLLLEGDIIRFLTGTSCDIPAKCMRSSHTYKEVLETLEEMGRFLNTL